MAAKKKTEATAKKITGTVTGGSLNVREKPDMEAKVIRALANGEQVEILEAGDEWHRIKGGYVMAKWVRLDG